MKGIAKTKVTKIKTNFRFNGIRVLARNFQEYKTRRANPDNMLLGNDDFARRRYEEVIGEKASLTFVGKGLKPSKALTQLVKQASRPVIKATKIKTKDYSPFAWKFKLGKPTFKGSNGEAFKVLVNELGRIKQDGEQLKKILTPSALKKINKTHNFALNDTPEKIKNALIAGGREPAEITSLLKKIKARKGRKF